MTSRIEIVVALPSEYMHLKSVIEARLREHCSDADIAFAEADSGECHVKSVTVPKAKSITDAETGEDVSAEATAYIADQIIGSVCHDEHEGNL